MFHQQIKFSIHLITDCEGEKIGLHCHQHIFAQKSFKVPRSSLKILQCYCRTFCNEISFRFIISFQCNCSELNQSRSSKLHPYSPATNNVKDMFCVSQIISYDMFHKRSPVYVLKRMSLFCKNL